MADSMVLKTQQWLNQTYNGKTGYISVTEDGYTGWNTIYALRRALQIELGITATSSNFGPSTTSKFNSRFPNGIHQQNSDDESEDNIYGIIQGACWCKGYSTGSNDITKHFYGGTAKAVKTLKSHAGCSDSSSTITLNVMKALLSMDQFQLVNGGSTKIQQIQQNLNKGYEDYIGLSPCDGLYGRSMNQSMIKVLQAIEGYSVDGATGNFGSGTKEKLPIVPSIGQINASTEEKAIKLVRYALCCNGYDVPITSGTWDSSLGDKIEEFQKDMCIEQSRICTVDTWMALLLSKGNPDRSCIGCDTRFEMTSDKLAYLKNNGYSIVGRYLTGGDFKELRPDEPQRILDAGLSFFPIFQESTTNVSYFTEERAIQDANNATQAAKKFRIPRRSIIYFAVDLDATDPQITSYVLPYFKKLYEYMNTQLFDYYRIGVYGTRNVCTQVMNNNYAVTSFVSDISTGYSGNMGFKMPKNWNFDQFHQFQVTTSSGTWDLDKDAFSGKFTAVTRLDTPTEKDLYTKLKNLYDLATEYCNNNSKNYSVKEKNELVLQYLRSEEYKGNLWSLIAGKIETDFVNYVYDRVSSELHPKNVTIPKVGYGEMPIPHLAATLNTRVNNFPILTNEANDLSGWAGDLIQLGGVIANNECTEQDIYDLIACNDNALANNLLNVSASETGYGLEDWELDIDAIGLTAEVHNGVEIHTAFKDYYTTDQYKNRMQTFAASLGMNYHREFLIPDLTTLAKRYTNLDTLTAQEFKKRYAENYNNDKYATILAEQFAKKIADYGDNI